MSSNSNYDLTGTLYSRSAVFARIDTSHTQVLELREPAYADSIVVTDFITNTVLTLNTHYFLDTSDYDKSALSDALVLANGEPFTKTFVKSITLKIGGTVAQKIRVTWNALYEYPGAINLDIPNGPDGITPGQVRYMFNELRFLRAQLAVTQSAVNIASLNNVRALDVDPTAARSENLVLDEVHNVNVPGGRAIIKLNAGSFYDADLVVTIGGVVIPVSGSDGYLPIVNNINKQKIATTPCKVFDYLQFTRPIVGDVSVTYRAYGGDLLIQDVQMLKDTLQSVMLQLAGNNFVTAGSLPYTPTMANVATRIRNIETYIRHYPMTSLTIKAEDNNVQHWYNFAYLTSMMAQSSTELPLQSAPVVTDDAPVTDMGEFIIESVTSKWSYHIAVQMDTRKSSNNLQIRTINNLPSTSYTDSINYTAVGNTIIPKLRMVWNEDGSSSGSVLQLGLVMPLHTTEIIRITNKSGVQGKWLLYQTVPGYSVDSDAKTTLPRSGEDWVYGVGRSIIRTIRPEDVITLAQGLVPLVRGYATTVPTAAMFNSAVEFAEVKAITIKVQDRATGKTIVATSRSLAKPTTGDYLVLEGFAWINEQLLHGVTVTLTNVNGAPGIVKATLVDMAIPPLTAVRYDLVSVGILY